MFRCEGRIGGAGSIALVGSQGFLSSGTPCPALPPLRMQYCVFVLHVSVLHRSPCQLCDGVRCVGCRCSVCCRYDAAGRFVDLPGLREDIKTFEARGGRYIIAPLEEEVMKSANFSFHVRAEDLVIPICHEGMNRSQVRAYWRHVCLVC